MSSKVGFAHGAVSAAVLSAAKRARRSPMETVVLMAQVAAERRALADADEARLRDLGLSAEDAAHEAARPFWDLPAHR